MLRHQENLYKTTNITYHGKYTPYPMLSYGPYDCPLCPVKGLYHMMCNIVSLVRGAEASSTPPAHNHYDYEPEPWSQGSDGEL